MYVIYNKETTVILRVLRNGYWQLAEYETEAAAKAGMTREFKRPRNSKLKKEDYAILDRAAFNLIEKTETKKNLLSGKEFTQRVNTPACCDPSTETYHSM